MSHENVEVVRRLNSAFNRGDVAGLIELLDPACEWWDRVDDPGAAVHRGHEGIGAYLSELADHAELRVEMTEFIDAGDYVVTPVRLDGRGRASGAPFEEHEVHVLRLRDGKVTEVREYRDKNEALQAVGLANPN
jgi:ketosteroid isomerase-like protein